MIKGKKADLIISELIIEGDRPAHIARHGVTEAEVQEVVERNYIYIEGKQERLLLIGKTKKDRYLAIIIGDRTKRNTYGLVTARDTSKKERQLYIEFVYQVGGDTDD